MRRALPIILAFLLMGAAVNVAVAWGCALWAPVRSVNASHATSKGAVREIVALVPDDWPAPDEYLIHDIGRGIGLSVHGLYIVAGFQITEARPFSMRLLRVQRAGWPLASFECHSISGRGGPPRSSHAAGTGAWHGAVRMPALVEEQLRGRRPDPLPARPMFFGLVFNTLLYGAAGWMMLCGPFTVRRWRRVRRGLCVGCGYPVEGLVRCPECGRTGRG